MSLQTLVKQPAESRLYSFDFSANLLGATISSLVSLTATPAGLDLTAPPTFSGTGVQQRVAGGTDGVTYKLTVRVTDSNGNTLEGEGLLQVEDI